MSKLLSLYGLKFHPFRPDVPHDALFNTPAVDSFIRRIELGIADGGFAMLTGDPGSGKSIALRLLAERLRALPDVLVGTVEHPQSRTMDFYRELGDLFGVPLASHNRWAGSQSPARPLGRPHHLQPLPPRPHHRRGPGDPLHRPLRATHPGQQRSR